MCQSRTVAALLHICPNGLLFTLTVARVAEKSPAKPTRGFDFTASLITVARNEKRTIMNALMHNVEVTEFFDLKANVRM